MAEIIILVALFLLIGHVVSKVQEAARQKEFDDLIRRATEDRRRAEEDEERQKMQMRSGRTID